MMVVENIEIIGDAGKRRRQFMIRTTRVEFERHMIGQKIVIIIVRTG